MKHVQSSRIGSFLALLALGLLSACDYPLTESPYTEVEPTDVPEVIRSYCLDSLLSDTIEVAGYKTVAFTMYLEDLKIYRATLLINDGVLAEAGPYSPGETISLEVNFIPEFYEDGFYSMKFITYFDNGALPIEDMVLEKNNIVSREFIIHYTTAPLATSFTSLAIEDGSLKVKWKPSAVATFDAYVIEAGRFDADSSFSSYYSSEYTNRADTCYTDSQVIGGNLYYRLRVRAGSFLSEPEYIKCPFNPQMSITSDANFKRTITWSKTPFYSNFGRVEILADGVLLATKTAIDDTTLIVDDGMLKPISYTLKIYPQTYSYYASVYTRSISYALDYDEFYSASYLSCQMDPPYYIFGTTNTATGDNIFRFAESTGEYLAAHIDYPGLNRCSYNGKFLYTDYYIVNPEDLSATRFVPQDVFEANTKVNVFSISNKGLLSGTIQDVYLYDIPEDRNVATLHSNYGQYDAKISPNEQYMVWPGYYLERLDFWKYDTLSASYLRLGGEYTGTDFGCNIEFVNDTTKSEFYHVWNDGVNGMVEKWSCESRERLESFQTPASYLLCIDPVNGNIVTYDDGTLYIYDPLSHQLLYRLAIDKSVIQNKSLPYNTSVVVINSIIYTPFGKLDLKKYETI